MQTFTVNIHDNLVDKVFGFLKSLPKNEVEIIETNDNKNSKDTNSKFTAISIDTKIFKFDREEANAR